MIAPRQPQTYSHPIYAQTLTRVCQAIRMFSPCFFYVLVSTGWLPSHAGCLIPNLIFTLLAV